MMQFLKRWLGGRPAVGAARPAAPVDRVDQVIARMEAMRRPCLRLVPAAAGRSRLGGAPEMRSAWPRFDGRPLSLVAQLDLGEARAAGGPDWLPASGRLLFFYEFEHCSWGLERTDAGSAVVLYETGPADLAPPPADLNADYRLEASPVRFAASASYPDVDRLKVDWRALRGHEERVLEDRIEALAPPSPTHQIDGWPSPVQADDMERQCQQFAPEPHGAAAAARGAQPPASDWRLLLQLDTDPAADMMWGDTGCLYFWVREQDARAGDFSRTWTILQCC